MNTSPMNPEFTSKLLRMGTRFVSRPLDRWAEDARRVAAAAGAYNGHPAATGNVLNKCRWFHMGEGAMLILSRDAGMHASGWWKNPDYDRCLHLSASFWDMEHGLPRGLDRKAVNRIVDAVFGRFKSLLWVESPFSPEGKASDVWHFRLFYAPDWSEPIHPKGEVYSRDWIPSGWKSWSDARADLAVPDFGDELSDEHARTGMEASR